MPWEWAYANASAAWSPKLAMLRACEASPDCEGTIAPGQSKTCTVSNVDLAPIKLALTADSAHVPSGGTAGYTATLTNPNEVPVTVSYVSVWLPSGFSYQQGSTTGAVTSDPSIDQGEGLYLAWEGPGQVPGNQNKALHFDVSAPRSDGRRGNPAAGWQPASVGSADHDAERSAEAEPDHDDHGWRATAAAASARVPEERRRRAGRR